MSPHRQLSQSSNRKPTQDQDIFLGFASTIPPADKDHPDAPRSLKYSCVLHDGAGVLESEDFTFDFTVYKDESKAKKEVQRFSAEILALMRKIQTNKKMNIRLIAVAEPVPEELKGKVDLFPVIWMHVDAVPFVVTPSTSIFTKLPNPATAANATAAVAAAVKYLHPATHSATTAETSPKDHRVLVDCNEQVKLCSLNQYEESTSPELWKRFMALAALIRQKKVSISFFSATPQGGGVALMRHALVRLCRLVGIDVVWRTPEGHPTIFDITKRKIHNVLQGVADTGEEMTDEDKRWFEVWTEQNYEHFWTDGALDADLVVIDDPQLTALVPIIKKKRPDAKIIFRSHIQIQSDLTDDPSTPQYRTWNYLFDFVKDVDLFLAHPVKLFVPKNVKETLPVLYMAPSTDPLDGLNKLYGHASVRYYRSYFNNLSASQCGVSIDWDRGYICQIARFDPSKGIDDLLAAYLKFRQKLEELDNPPADGGPQLIIMGHGSVDDPDGTRIYEEAHGIVSKPEYELVKGDVSIVRAPPSDSILGCILQGAWVATQLSTREGFEIKVTEAINKRVPIIASDAGGIPLQVKHGKNGWVVPTGDSSAVAQLLFDIHEGRAQVHRDLSRGRDLNGKTDPNSVAEAFVGSYDNPVPRVRDDEHATSEDFWTVGNTTRWLLLASRILGLSPERLVEDEYGATEGSERLLQDMGVGKEIPGKGSEPTNVWKMVMGNDLIEGEGALI